MTPEQTKALNAPLDAGRVKKRQGRGAGPALSYLETHDAIRTANTIFGFGQWGHEIVELRPLTPITVTNRDNKPGQQVGYVCIVRLTVEGCVPVSGIGYGDAVEYTQSAQVTAHELAAKEAESDALKRALKNYGDQFGLALYDKDAARAGHIASAPTGASKTAGPPAVSAQAAGEDGNAPAPAAKPTDAQLETLFTLVHDKGGDVAKTRTGAEQARAEGKLGSWYPAAVKYWEAQTKGFKAPAGAAA